jgi:hypothetical protein
VMFDRREHRHDEDDTKLRSPAPREESPASTAERTPSGLGTNAMGPLPVPRHLLEQLRTYPRLRDLVFGYLLVQERIGRYEDIMSDLDDAGEQPDRPFWARLHRQLGAEGLRGDFPSDLLADPEFEMHMTTFDSEQGKARAAAMAGRNPHQSAQSAGVAYAAVTAILGTAEELAVLCKIQARNLLNELYDTVNKIFADEEKLPAYAIGATERFTGASLTETPDLQTPSVRGIEEKQLQGSPSVQDFETHLLAKRGAT